MMASRSAVSFVLLHVSIILLILRNDKVAAWQIGSNNGSRVAARKTNTVGTTAVSHHNPSDDGQPEITSTPRRELLFLIPKMAAATTIATATVMTLPQQRALAAGGMTADSARDQWKNASPAIDELLQNWSTEKWAEEVGGGDIIRTKLGQMGTTSPLFQIEKALKALGDSDYVDDFIEFTETGEEFMDALYQADSLANSSNLKTGSGKQTPPAVFIEQSRKEVEKMQSIAKRMDAMVK
eukprot:CAMPEP_0196235838 /NCGR_PEP_ID=MMETSP0913-20130531/5450_1 /TAXON_ID=49265 /ORGANISM="Thalassiosira rotula, Strain GSO102" /LENGTH=238 /DNA_ID=CAMNT_0041517155 /DNA_START=29 /DNA_END=745 /DNA_ORIENTATION=+